MFSCGLNVDYGIVLQLKNISERHEPPLDFV